MGIGGGIFLIALGAILTFAVHVNPTWLDLQIVGWVLMLSGLTTLLLTIWYGQRRRRGRAGLTLVEQTQLTHNRSGTNPVLPEPPDTDRAL